MFCNVLVDVRVSSAGQQRPPVPAMTTQGVPIRPTRHRKVSRSAGPSVAALRKALMISGGECDFNVLVYSMKGSGNRTTCKQQAPKGTLAAGERSRS